MSPLADSAMLSIDAEWDCMCDIIDEEEIFSNSSSKANSDCVLRCNLVFVIVH